MQCPSCGARIEAPDRFCSACGSRVKHCRSIPCPVCQYPCNVAMKVCPQCQTPLELDNGLSAIPLDASLQERAFCLLRRSFVRFADFQGRSSRSEFFLFMAFCQFAGLVLAAVWWPLASLFSAVMLIPSYAVSVRRMRDAGYWPWTPFVLSGVAAALLTLGIVAGAVLGFSASSWRLPLALIGVSTALLLLVCVLFLFLVLQPTAEPGEEKRIFSHALRIQGQDGPFPQPAGPQQPFPGQPGPQIFCPGQPFPQQPDSQAPIGVSQGAFPGQPAQPFPGQPCPQAPFGGPQGAFPGRPAQPCPGQPYPDQPCPVQPFPSQPCPQPTIPQASCQPPFAGAEAQLPGQPRADGAPSAFADQLAGAEGQDEAPAGTSPTERQASPAPDALPAEEPGQPAERLICRQELDAGAAQASAGGRDGSQDGRA